jgi:hypothetical protein
MTDVGPIETGRSRADGMGDTAISSPVADRAGGSATVVDLSAKAADTIDLIVDTVHDRAIRPMLVLARAVAFGMLAAVLGLMVMVLASVALLRLLDVYVFPGRVWASYTLLGTIFVAVGLFVWTLRNSSTAGTGGPS